MRYSFRLFVALLGAGLCASCATFGGDPPEATGSAALLESTLTEKSLLERRVARLETENARLSNELMAARRANEEAVAARETQSAPPPKLTTAPAPKPRAEPPAPPPAIVAELPQPTGDQNAGDEKPSTAVIDNPDAPELASSAPIESSPRLVQPTFTATDDVFQNDAETAPGAPQSASALYGVHLASYRRESEAREGWRQLQKENPSELGLLEPRLDPVSVDARGEFLRLIGGGLASREKADALCENLKAKGLYCAVSEFTGQRLSLGETG